MKKIENRDVSDTTNIDKIKDLFPSAITEGKIDFDKLKLILGEDIESSEEKYEFTWPGKIEMEKSIYKKSRATLRPKEINGSQNLYIEGDNFEVLKILKENYTGKIKCIYIDPPYNTNTDLIYEDNYNESIENYKKFTQKRKHKNLDNQGRLHSAWLNMMYPRLVLARDLLTEDGAIFISIDNTENVNLKKICDEIFLENNFLGMFPRKTKTSTGDDGTGINDQHDYLHAYALNKDNCYIHGALKKYNGYHNKDNDSRGEWTSGDPSAKSGSDTTYFGIENPITGQVDFPPKGRFWAFSKTTMAEYIETGRIKFKDSIKDNQRGFIFKRYKNELQSPFNTFNSLEFDNNYYLNEKGTADLDNLRMKDVFSYPKPVMMLEKIFESMELVDNDIVLDFFSGSATSSHAILNYNKNNNYKVRFILAQLPEPLEYNYDNKDNIKKDTTYHAIEFCKELKVDRNLAEIGKERIRRCTEELFGMRKDLFDVLYLDTSNIKPFESFESSLDDDAIDPIKSGRSSLDVLYEMMFRHGITFTTSYEKLDFEGCEVYNVGYGEMFYLASNITFRAVELIIDYCKENGITLNNSKFIFREVEIKDEDKDSTKMSIEHLLQGQYNIQYIRGI